MNKKTWDLCAPIYKRAMKADQKIYDFIKRKPDGIIVQLGCGLETTCYRDDNGHTKWYGKAGLK